MSIIFLSENKIKNIRKMHRYFGCCQSISVGSPVHKENYKKNNRKLVTLIIQKFTI